MEKNGELVEIDDESSMTRVHYQPWNRVTIHQSRNGGWRGDFFVLRRILINRFVSFRRFAASNPLERFRLHHLSVLKEGRAPLSSTRYIIRDFCQSPSSRGHRGRRSCMKAAPGLRALCLWFHNFRRRDVRRSRREREKRSEFNIGRSASKTSFEEGRVSMNGFGRWMNFEHVERWIDFQSPFPQDSRRRIGIHARELSQPSRYDFSST